MSKNKRIAIYEPWLFGILILANLTPLFFYRWFPTLDGPAHLYTSRVITGLLSGDPLFKDYFTLNLLTANLSCHFILALLNLAFPAWLTEKIFIGILVTAIPLAFRYLILKVQTKPGLLHLLIFPFSWNFLLMLGFYNYALGLTLSLFILGWYIGKRDNFSWKQMLVLSILLFVLVLTHGFVFLMFCLVFGLFKLFNFFIEKSSVRKGTILKAAWTEWYLYVLAFIPAIAFFFLSMRGPSELNPATRYLNLLEHLQWLAVTRPVIAFAWKSEWLWGLLVTFSLLIPIFWVISRMIHKDPQSNPDGFGLAFLLSASVLLLLFILVPDYLGGMGGHLSVRIMIFFYCMIIGWISVQRIPEFLQILSILLFLIPQVMLTKLHLEDLKPLNSEVKAIERMSLQIPEGTVVFPVNCSNYWLQSHFFSYLGVEKNILVLENMVALSDGVISWKPQIQQMLLRYGGKALGDTSLFLDESLMKRVDCFAFRQADNIPVKNAAYARNLMGNYAPIDTLSSDYPDIYINRKLFPLRNWKHESDLSLKRYYNITSKPLIESEFLNILQIPANEIPVGEMVWLEVNANLETKKAKSEDSLYLVMMTERKGKKLKYQAIVTPLDSSGSAISLRLKYRFREKLQKDDLVKLYFWNPDTANVLIQQSMIRVNYFN
jgi:hypothetical protein